MDMIKRRDLSIIKGVHTDYLRIAGIFRMPEPSLPGKKWKVLYRLIKKPQAINNISQYHATVAAHTVNAFRKRRQAQDALGKAKL